MQAAAKVSSSSKNTKTQTTKKKTVDEMVNEVIFNTDKSFKFNWTSYGNGSMFKETEENFDQLMRGKYPGISQATINSVKKKVKQRL